MVLAREYADSLGIKTLPDIFIYDVFDSYISSQDSLATSYGKIGTKYKCYS